MRGTWGTCTSFSEKYTQKKKIKKSPGNRVECAPCAPKKIFSAVQKSGPVLAPVELKDDVASPD
jgi:hypothetical protein